MQVDGLPVVPAPHHRRILEKLATMKASMPGGRKTEGVLAHFGYVVCEAHAFDIPGDDYTST